MIDHLPVQKIVAATEVRNGLGDLLNRDYRREEHIVVEKLGIPVAAIISMSDYDEFRRFLAKQQLDTLVLDLGAEADRQRLTEEILFAELKETRKEVFAEMYGNRATKS